MGNLKFQKRIRLFKKSEIDKLFAGGTSFNLSPIRVIYLVSPGPSSRTLFSVPSRTFKRAIDRNLLKRRMREAYRINQLKLDVPVKLNLAYIYIAKQILPFSEIEKKVIQSFKRLSHEFKK